MATITIDALTEISNFTNTLRNQTDWVGRKDVFEQMTTSKEFTYIDNLTRQHYPVMQSLGVERRKIDGRFFVYRYNSDIVTELVMTPVSETKFRYVGEEFEEVKSKLDEIIASLADDDETTEETTAQVS